MKQRRAFQRRSISRLKRNNNNNKSTKNRALGTSQYRHNVVTIRIGEYARLQFQLERCWGEQVTKRGQRRRCDTIRDTWEMRDKRRLGKFRGNNVDSRLTRSRSSLQRMPVSNAFLRSREQTNRTNFDHRNLPNLIQLQYQLSTINYRSRRFKFAIFRNSVDAICFSIEVSLQPRN